MESVNRENGPNSIPKLGQWKVDTHKEKNNDKRSDKLIAIDNLVGKYEQAKAKPKNYEARYKLSKELQIAIKNWKGSRKQSVDIGVNKRVAAIDKLDDQVNEELYWLETERRKLWMKSGSLNELESLMDGQAQLWSTLSEKLIDYCYENPKLIKGGILDCGKLIISSKSEEPKGIELNLTGGNNLPKNISDELVNFLTSFMKANGQLAYIESKDWFTNNVFDAVVEINFYPEREFKEDDNRLGVHKDTDSRNLFVNLIFNNTTSMPATEWTWDEMPPDKKRLEQELEMLLPEEEVSAILSAKDSIRNSGLSGLKNWEGGLVQPNGYVSWIDELIWHSTPAIEKRLLYDKEDVKELFANKVHHENIFLYEAMLILAKNNSEINKRFGDKLIDFNTWRTEASSLHDVDRIVDRKMLETHIESFAWSTHKISGDGGQVEVVGSEEGRYVPTHTGGRPRANSNDSEIRSNKSAIEEMKRIRKGAFDGIANPSSKDVVRNMTESDRRNFFNSFEEKFQNKTLIDVLKLEYGEKQVDEWKKRKELPTIVRNNKEELLKMLTTSHQKVLANEMLGDERDYYADALKEGKIGVGLPTRSFIRTWVTLVRR